MKNLKKSLSVALLAIALIVSTSFIPSKASATGEKFMINAAAYSDSTHLIVVFDVLDGTNISQDTYAYASVSGITSEDLLKTAEVNAVLNWAHNIDGSYPSATANDVIGPFKSNLATVATSGSYNDLTNLPTLPSALSFNNTPSHSIVTTAGAANGWQISSTRNTSVFYSVNVNTTATIAGNADGYVVLEISATNSTTASDWKEVSRTRNGQSLSLALTLQSVQNIGSELMNIVPAGYYVRLRSVNVSGTPTYSYISGQEVQL